MPPTIQLSYVPPKRSKKWLLIIGIVVLVVIVAVTVGLLLSSHPNVTNKTAVEQPLNIKAMTATYVTTTQIVFLWPTVASATSYELDCSTASDFSASIISSTTTESNGSCNGLTANTTYYARFRATVKNKEGAWSSNLKVQTATQIGMVSSSSIQLKALSATSVSYAWAPVTGASTYNIQWSSDPDFIKDMTTITQLKTSGTSTNLKTKTTYYYRVQALPASSAGTITPYSAAVSISTL